MGKKKSLRVMMAVLSAAVLMAGAPNMPAASAKAAAPVVSESSSQTADKVLAQRYAYTVTEHPTFNAGKYIYGELYRPARSGKIPLIIFSHELAASHETGVDYAKELASRGAAVYIFDYCGGGDHSRSDGKTTDMSVMTEVSDLESVLKTAEKWDFVDKDHIVLLGGSQGGAVASIVASRHADELQSMILLYPAFVITDDLHKTYASLDDVEDVINYRGWITVGKRYVADMWNFDVYKDMGKFKKPVLLIHGDKDQAVPLEYSKKAAAVYPKGKLHIIHGTDHMFPERSSLNEAMHEIVTFLKEQDVLPGETK
ncbi:MAG: alpha/beta fold hydrolase [Acidaminococcus sp.]|jgi:pimeloyl-ACP methyl ester carboxylesterase|nr:alpha/beta fold hydrolase [Acidaminococcus sp.]MCI2115354.1 alpha/beta fold hydrolase [Acidaminococcus sp.]MCI2117420.1 alpha/beta fold hydrolase [Acidaminococcus sp.]